MMKTVILAATAAATMSFAGAAFAEDFPATPMNSGPPMMQPMQPMMQPMAQPEPMMHKKMTKREKMMMKKKMMMEQGAQ